MLDLNANIHQLQTYSILNIYYNFYQEIYIVDLAIALCSNANIHHHQFYSKLNKQLLT